MTVIDQALPVLVVMAVSILCIASARQGWWTRWCIKLTNNVHQVLSTLSGEMWIAWVTSISTLGRGRHVLFAWCSWSLLRAWCFGLTSVLKWHGRFGLDCCWVGSRNDSLCSCACSIGDRYKAAFHRPSSPRCGGIDGLLAVLSLLSFSADNVSI